MPVWQKTPGRPSHLPVASAQRPRAPVSVSVWKAESWWLSRDSCPNSRDPGSATRSFQLALGKHGHLQAGAPAPAGPLQKPCPSSCPEGVGAATPQRQPFQGLGSSVCQESHKSLKKAHFCFQKQLTQGPGRDGLWGHKAGTLRRKRGCL